MRSGFADPKRGRRCCSNISELSSIRLEYKRCFQARPLIEAGRKIKGAHSGWNEPLGNRCSDKGYAALSGWQAAERQIGDVVGDQGLVDWLEAGEFDADAAGRGYVAHNAFGVEGVLAANFYADVRADGQFRDGREHAAYAQIAGATGEAVEAIAIAYGYGAVFFSAVKETLCGTFHVVRSFPVVLNLPPGWVAGGPINLFNMLNKLPV